MKDNMRIIATEEHFAPPSNEEAFAQKSEQERVEEAVITGQKHVAAMDAVGIDVQVLMPSSVHRKTLLGKEDIEFCENTNSYLYDMVRHNPGRLEGFAIVPLSDPEAAAAELGRTVAEYGFKGVMLASNVGGKYLDDPKYTPIFEQAVKLDVPVYLHPATASKELFELLYAGNYSNDVATLLSRSGWGWHIETGLSLVRLIMSGLFDRYKSLNVIVGHLGEAVPFMLQRMELRLPQQLTKLERTIAEYLRENVFYTFGGFNYLPPFLNLYMEMGADRIMFSADYPHNKEDVAVDFLMNLPISDADRRRIAHENAERLIMKTR